jgi:hypothetical protein
MIAPLSHNVRLVLGSLIAYYLGQLDSYTLVNREHRTWDAAVGIDIGEGLLLHDFETEGFDLVRQL